MTTNTESGRYIEVPGATGETMKFECACGEDIEIEIGLVNDRLLPVCECGRAWIVRYTTLGRRGKFAVVTAD